VKWGNGAEQLVSHRLNVGKLSQQKPLAWEYFISTYFEWKWA